VPRLRFLVWRGLDESLAEAAEVRLEEDALVARGTQLGAAPRPYRVDYELTTGTSWVTERLRLIARDDEGERTLDLRRDSDGAWSANGDSRPELRGALDCDLQWSPLTNTMPILREGGGPVDLTMAWVSVPDLGVGVSRQRYEPIGARRVRYVSRDSDFTAELELDEEGLLVYYPGLGERV
jgi:hypothetical protein